ncbi:ligase [Paracidovorax avenae]|uniref:O-antigen ligase family protein n=1 Tax=Paracidovorax avenae TaxID=80867 RepID=UPI000D15FDB8|nr:O-antigen ligase family protein [Paracidovorax avenae]AVS61174.1 ligase [Paracidovorax avenae]
MTGLAVPSGGAVRQPSQVLLVAACLAAYLLFCLQQVVVAGGAGGGLSLGSVVLLGCMSAVSAWALWRQGVPPFLFRPLLAILACMAVLAASVLASGHASLAFRFAVRYATALLALWAMLNLAVACPRWPRAATLAALIALWLNLALGVAVLVRWPPALRFSLAFHAEDTFKYLPRISGMYEHPALLAASSLVVALLVLQLHRRGELGRAALALALLGAASALALTQVRNALLPAGLLLAWCAWPRSGLSRLHRRLAAAALLGLAAIAGLVLWQRYADMTSASRENLLTAVSLGRTYIWAGAVEAWRGHPWFGLGPGVFQFLVPDYTGGRFLRGELHAHNLVLAALSETGLFGLLAGLGLLHALWAPLLQAGGGMRRWALAWLCLLLGMGVFDFYLPFYPFSLHAALAVAVLYAIARKMPRRPVPDLPR